MTWISLLDSFVSTRLCYTWSAARSAGRCACPCAQHLRAATLASSSLHSAAKNLTEASKARASPYGQDGALKKCWPALVLVSSWEGCVCWRGVGRAAIKQQQEPAWKPTGAAERGWKEMRFECNSKCCRTWRMTQMSNTIMSLAAAGVGCRVQGQPYVNRWQLTSKTARNVKLAKLMPTQFRWPAEKGSILVGASAWPAHPQIHDRLLVHTGKKIHALAIAPQDLSPISFPSNWNVDAAALLASRLI